MSLPKIFLVSGALLAAHASQAQRVAVLKFPQLQQRLLRASDTTYVVNFWATWCGPCVQELPGYEKVRAAMAGQKVKFLLVSLDYASQLTKKVQPFVQKRQIKSEVVLLDEPDPNTWLMQVDRRWSGSIPFTLILNTNAKKRVSYEQPLTEKELTAALRKFPL